MKLSSLLPILAAATTAIAAPVQTQGAESHLNIPQEAVLGFIDLGNGNDIQVTTILNGTQNGILLFNSTVANAAAAPSDSTLAKRDADAWHWLRFNRGEPMYKRSASADADAWHWLRFSKGEPLHRRNADADADAWHWLRFNRGEPMY
ncbi:uncharacterized protein Ecym_3070 [Eremothecium cymbalariae DBVPG|uniref:Mating factor alpha precursor N-terminal domain-containing protein n=2 Tax=Eremothecium cymbalariae TaxID=45285 RepID=G8JR13_ERECY|nr:Hypothetical protein Ecym_3070 [Eremothecium cymbalariae DBVPG\